MSVRRLHDLLREHARDDQITLAEVGELIAESKREDALTPGERLTLEAALEAHRAAFTPEALKALVSYLAGQSS